MISRLARLVLVLCLMVSPLSPTLAQDILGLGGSGETAAAGEAPAPLDTLIEVLKDDAARQALIEELEARAAGGTGDGATEAEREVETLGGQIADVTQNVSESAARSVTAAWRQLGRLPTMFGAMAQADYEAVARLLLDLGVLVVITYGVFLGLRRLSDGFRRMLKLSAARSSVWAAVVAVVFLLVSNLLIVAAAWAVGHVVALALIGNGGEMPFHHTLFLNAFLVVEAVQAVVRAIVAPRRSELRFLPLADIEARRLTRWSRITVSVLAFGQLLLVPVFTRFVSVQVGQAVATLVYVVVLAMALNLVLRLRAPVAQRLLRLASGNRGGLLHFLARLWHVPILIYLLVLFIVVVIWPSGVLPAMLLATGKIIAAVVLGLIVANLLTRLILNGVKLPGRITNRIPLLEQRLNAFVPRALTVLWLLVVIVVAAVTLDAVGLFSLADWLDSEFGARVATATITVAVILTIAFAAWLALSSWVDYRLQPATASVVTARERTLLSLMRNAVTIAIVVFTLMFTLSEIGINIAPLLASAGVIGLAIGFGAQKLVQDIITGVFIQLEGAIDVGDVVNIGGISGSVERLTIRSAGLRDVNGVYHIVPFSSVDVVSNFMRGFAFALCDMGVAYRENLDDVKAAMVDAYEALKQNPDVKADLVDPQLEWMGIDKFLDSAVVVRARIKTLPGRQWAVNRAYNAEVKKVFDARGIEIPFPHQTLYFGEDKRGRAAPMHIVAERPQRPTRAEAEGEKPPQPARKRRRVKRHEPEVPDTDDFTPPEER